MDNFIKVQDELSDVLQRSAADLYQKLRQLPVDALGMPEPCLIYFKGSHFKRLFFSIQTSAHLLYKAISVTGKKHQDIVIMDYGAGVGTLYTLAKMIGCKKVIYNDHLPEWKQSAQLIAEAIGIQVDHYIVGDIKPTLDELKAQHISCDIITSRNVIEHIYQLDDFYAQVYHSQPQALVYCSTTANHKNPASRWKHQRWHRKWEPGYAAQRMQLIREEAPSLSEKVVQELGARTRGLARPQIMDRVRKYILTKQYPERVNCGTNTCDPANGVWAEHMISFDEYRHLINEKQYSVSFAPGFWDTHYNNGFMNIAGTILNAGIRLFPSIGCITAPFIYVIAKPIPRQIPST